MGRGGGVWEGEEEYGSRRDRRSVGGEGGVVGGERGVWEGKGNWRVLSSLQPAWLSWYVYEDKCHHRLVKS